MKPSAIKKQIRDLQKKKYRDELELFCVEGIKGVEEALQWATSDVQYVAYLAGRGAEDVAQRALDKDIPVYEMEKRDVSYISSTETFSGVLAVVKKPAIKDIESGFVLALDGIRDPGNLGTLLRSADWFGCTQIVLSEDCVDMYNPKVVRSSMGSIFHVSARVVHLEDWLKERQDQTVAGLVLDGEPLDARKDEDEELILVIGSESHGIRPPIEKLLNARYTIAGYGDAESLNAAVAGSIALHSLTHPK